MSVYSILNYLPKDCEGYGLEVSVGLSAAGFETSPPPYTDCILSPWEHLVLADTSFCSM